MKLNQSVKCLSFLAVTVLFLACKSENTDPNYDKNLANQFMQGTWQLNKIIERTDNGGIITTDTMYGTKWDKVFVSNNKNMVFLIDSIYDSSTYRMVSPTSFVNITYNDSCVIKSLSSSSLIYTYKLNTAFVDTDVEFYLTK